MSLLDDIRNDLIDVSARLPDTLRKALVLAHMVHSPDLQRWAESELDGYSIGDNIPTYRQVPLPVFGDFYGSVARFRRQILTTRGLPDEVRRLADNLLVPLPDRFTRI